MEKRVVICIEPKWLQMIFNEEKGLEFRNKIIPIIKPETVLYFCEKQKNGTIGNIVGQAIVANVKEIKDSQKSLYYECFNYVGYTNQKYAIRFIAVKKYEKPVEILEFNRINVNSNNNLSADMFEVRREISD